MLGWKIDTRYRFFGGEGAVWETEIIVR